MPTKSIQFNITATTNTKNAIMQPPRRKWCSYTMDFWDHINATHHDWIRSPYHILHLTWLDSTRLLNDHWSHATIRHTNLLLHPPLSAADALPWRPCPSCTVFTNPLFSISALTTPHFHVARCRSTSPFYAILPPPPPLHTHFGSLSLIQTANLQRPLPPQLRLRRNHLHWRFPVFHWIWRRD